MLVTLYTPMVTRTNTLYILSDSNHGAFQKFLINENRDGGCGAPQSLFQFFLYRPFSGGVASWLATAIFVSMVTPILYDNFHGPNDSNLKYELSALWLIFKKSSNFGI